MNGKGGAQQRGRFFSARSRSDDNISCVRLQQRIFKGQGTHFCRAADHPAKNAASSRAIPFEWLLHSRGWVKASFDAGWSLQHVKGSVAIQRVRLESDGVSGEEGGADDGVAEATVLELRVDNAVIYACLNLTKFNGLGAPGAGTPMALILKTCGTAAAFSAGRGASKSCTKPSKRG